MLKILPLLALFSLFAIVSPGLAAPIPPAVLEKALLYQGGYACSLVDPQRALPFFLLVDQAGTGYFADQGNLDRLHPNGVPVKVLPSGAPDDWIRTMKSFDLNMHKAWTKLNLKTAKEVWGEPRTHLLSGRRFHTFDATGISNEERNIYHVDLQFDKFDQVLGYRLRGIGICNAKWVVKIDENRITITD